MNCTKVVFAFVHYFHCTHVSVPPLFIHSTTQRNLKSYLGLLETGRF
jgi:hypothetical protein